MTLHWLHNVRACDLADALNRDELHPHVWRKAYMAQWYATEYVIIGPPQATAQHSVGSLEALGLVGVYGMRRGDE